MQKDIVYDEHSDIISIPLEGVMEDSAQRVEYSFRKSKTSDFFDENIRTFAQRSPMFCYFRTAASLPSTNNFFERFYGEGTVPGFEDRTTEEAAP